MHNKGFPGDSMGKESTCNTGDAGSIRGSGRSPGGGHGSHSSILASRILWIEGPGRLQSIGEQRIVKLLSRVRLFAILWSVAYQASPSMEFSRQEYWSGLPFPSPEDHPDQGIEPRSPTLQADA